VKKIVFVILPLLLLSFLLAKPSIAGPKVIPGTTPVITGPNPGPPVGITCGNTMCLPGEVCIKYPQDLDLHCVAQSIIDDPITPIGNDPDVPEDCWKQLGSQNGIFPPNSACWNHFQNTQVDISQYERTCIYEPVVHYSAVRHLNSLTPEKDQPFNMCGIGDSGPGGPPAPGGGNFDCTVSMLVYTDVREAETGSYGPSPDAEASYSADFIAQNYLYTSLFGRPMDLSTGYDPQNTAGNDGRPTREAYRTYWRLLPASNQANLRSFVLNMADKDQIDNIIFNFTDRNGLDKKTSFKKLYNALSKQVILFWHWPFVRVGCLTDYPVCPEYAQATQSLKPTFQDLREMATELDLGWLVDASIGLYETAISAFGGDLDGPYAAFVPLDFNSTRSYIVKKKDEFEEEMYFKNPWYDPRLIDQYNSGRYGTNKPGLTNVSRESVPYVGAIYQGLLSPKFGMLPALQPQWIIDKYASPSGISDYRIGNTPLSLPEVKLAQKGFLERIEEEAVAIISNPLGWLWNKVNNLFTDDELKRVGYTENEIDNLNEKVKDGYYNVACPLPVSYHLMAPKTAAGDKGDPNQVPADDHHQVISIAGDQLAWNYNPACHPPEEREKCDLTHCWIEYDSCPINDWAGKYKDPGSGMCCTRRWSVEGIKHGKTLNILNNPKQTDIKEAVVNNDQYSFYKMMLPDGVDKTIDASIDAPIARNFVSYRGSGVNAGNTATAPNGNSEILNPAEPINRVNNLAQDSMHILQNCWAVPKSLQNSPRCFPLPTPTPAYSDSCPVVEDSAVDAKYLGTFKSHYIGLADSWTTSCSGPDNNLAEECYNYVASEAKKAGVNPAFALTMWLEESGASNYCYLGETAQDMGINLSNLYQDIVGQLEIFLNMAQEKKCSDQVGNGFFEPMHAWLSRFRATDFQNLCDPTNFCGTAYTYGGTCNNGGVDVTYGGIINIWSMVAGSGCVNSGRFVLDWPTDMSCP